LNGGLPIWANSGGYVKVDAEWFLIEDVLFDESKNAEIIVISSSYSGVDVSVIAGTIYNIFDYEIYECTIDMVDYIGETIKVAIKAEDDNFTTINLLSEDISVASSAVKVGSFSFAVLACRYLFSILDNVRSANLFVEQGVAVTTVNFQRLTKEMAHGLDYVCNQSLDALNVFGWWRIVNAVLNSRWTVDKLIQSKVFA
jgi:hypothetical protein